MKVALIYHESAGDGLEHDVLVRTIEAHGHQVLSVATPEDDGHRVDETGADVVVAAGGDGTIARVARALAHSQRADGHSAARHREQHCHELGHQRHAGGARC